MRTAGLDLLTAFHFEQKALAVLFKFLHFVKMDNMAAMDAHKQLWIELLLQRPDSMVGQEYARWCVHTSTWEATLDFADLRILGTGGSDSRQVQFYLRYNFGYEDVEELRKRESSSKEERERI